MARTVLFKPPVSIESGYAPSEIRSNVIPFPRRTGLLAGLGLNPEEANALNTGLQSSFKFGTDLLESITGAKGQREAQERALALAQVQAEKAQSENLARSAGLTENLPWLVAGGVAVVAVVVWAFKKR